MLEKLNKFSSLLLLVVICVLGYQLWQSKKDRDNPQLDQRVQKAIEDSINRSLAAQLQQQDFIRTADLAAWGDTFQDRAGERFARQDEALRATLASHHAGLSENLTGLETRIAGLDLQMNEQLQAFDGKIETLVKNTALDAASIAVKVAARTRPTPYKDFVALQTAVSSQVFGSAAAARSGANSVDIDPIKEAVLIESDWSNTASAGAQKLAALAPSAVQAAPQPVLMQRVHFDPNSDALTPGGKRRAIMAAEQLKSMKEQGMKVKRVRLVGFSDTVGNDAVNQALSARRAKAVASILKQAGLSSDMIEVVANGESNLPEPTGDKVAEPLNRCVGIIAITE